jgi:hypothetical protein
MRFFAITVLLTLGIASCVTSDDASSKASKKDVACYCGTIKPSREANPVCAVWAKGWKKKQPQYAIATSDKEKCGLEQCKSLGGDENPCTSYEEYPRPPARNVSAPCYCDIVPIYGNPLGESACAIWRAGDQELLEYHFVADCEIETCQMSPFVYSESYCNNQFQKYYSE